MSQASYSAAQYKDARTRAGARFQTARRDGKRNLGRQLWALLYACSLLSGPGGQASDAESVESDYLRLARNSR